MCWCNYAWVANWCWYLLLDRPRTGPISRLCRLVEVASMPNKRPDNKFYHFISTIKGLSKISLLCNFRRSRTWIRHFDKYWESYVLVFRLFWPLPALQTEAKQQVNFFPKLSNNKKILVLPTNSEAVVSFFESNDTPRITTGIIPQLQEIYYENENILDLPELNFSYDAMFTSDLLGRSRWLQSSFEI